MIARFAAAIGVGTCVTFGLLFLMQALIARGGGLNDPRDFLLKDFVRVEREIKPEKRVREIEPPPDPMVQPQMPMVSTQESFDTRLNISLDRPVIDSNMSMGDLGFGVRDGDYLPVSRITPQYPPRAAQRGLQGHVIVEFTVTREGTTRDVKVIESSNAMFERSAIEAASRFKFRPRVVDGEPVMVSGVRNRITYVLEN